MAPKKKNSRTKNKGDGPKESTTVRKTGRKRQESFRRAQRTGRSTRSTGFLFDTNGTGRTQHQARRDAIARRLPKDWLGDGYRQGQQRPRGIRNPGAHCWWNTVLQSFMHMPIFLHWIISHEHRANCEDNCVRCSMKGIVEEYWRQHPNSSQAISFDNASLRELKQKHAGETPWLDTDGHQDPHEGFTYLVNKLGNDDYLDTNYRPINDRDKEWLEEFETIFKPHVVVYHTCSVCGIETPTRDPDYISMRITVKPDGAGQTPYTDVQAALAGSIFGSETMYKRCGTESCEAQQMKNPQLYPQGLPHRTAVRLRGAPRILHLQVGVFDYDKEKQQSLKLPDFITINEDLDVSAFQETTRNGQPLTYRLSSVVAHAGISTHAGHNIASVRSAPDRKGNERFYSLSDERMERINRQRFLANPQTHGEESEEFSAYLLTYIMDEIPEPELTPRQQRALRQLA